ncbi:DarT ssDNA thymidine ADP-ribosyltransferase family protein [Companilactobacillus ginsenosidimutans]|uniref:DarT domain-containing protein n=1 Tax=Companilactobacillus ginsenosidimutans TaxID=1007676 RepID=A0A0H4QLI9_9LACO|nr:DarT ssDNA thymidine ADP-ribosyltransferase family protein [Companilactobacillus ginsenosidimutans]AKP67573.1 hypothetical protein ABM34_08535 [Companilactobacillus ginsenosidimutans]
MRYKDIIEDLVNDSEKTGLRKSKRRYWPKYAFHFTDIDNAMEILKNKKIHSRYFVEHNSQMSNDNANLGVINQTDIEVEKVIRLYFRPKTPTQYYNEGFKTAAEIKDQDFSANCPIPIFFLFDMSTLLEIPGVKFTDFSLATKRTPHYMNTPEEFERLPFDKIYFDDVMTSDMTKEERKELTDQKQAEIVVPDPLKLNTLRWIYTRSEAEKETLINLLHKENITNLDSKIRVAYTNTYFSNRNYVKKVTLSSKGYSIVNNVDDNRYQPYPLDSWEDVKYAVNPDDTDNYLNVQLKIFTDGNVYTWPQKGKKALLKQQMTRNFQKPIESYTLQMLIDNHIAYEGKCDTTDDMPY